MIVRIYSLATCLLRVKCQLMIEFDSKKWESYGPDEILARSR